MFKVQFNFKYLLFQSKQVTANKKNVIQPLRLEAEIVEATLVISQFRFLRVGSRIIVGYQPEKIRQRRY